MRMRKGSGGVQILLFGAFTCQDGFSKAGIIPIPKSGRTFDGMGTDEEVYAQPCLQSGCEKGRLISLFLCLTKEKGCATMKKIRIYVLGRNMSDRNDNVQRARAIG